MIKHARFSATGTTCESCAEIIRKAALKVEGLISIKFDYATETGSFEYDDEKTSVKQVLSAIEGEGYSCTEIKEKDKENYTISTKALAYVMGVIGLAIIAYFAITLADKIALPTISPTMGYSLLFLVGILTGFHCIAMCGSFVVSYTANAAQKGKSTLTSHLAYATGKTLSYTIIGAAFGLLGSFIAFTPQIRGIAGIIAGLFLVIFGLKMLNIIPGLRRFGIKAPGFIRGFAESHQNSGPLVIGLLNGLMIACGPLQAIYVMAAGTGSMFEGAKLLFIFAIGTLPVMLGFGYITSFLSSKATKGILKASGVLVIILGLIMASNGLALTGTYSLSSIASSVTSQGTPDQSPQISSQGYQEIRMNVDASGYSPNSLVLKKGVPVKWIINVKELTSCNSELLVPKYGLDVKLKQGEQTVEFIPTEEGIIPFSCWMGMLHGQFVVKADTQTDAEALSTAPKVASGSSCGCGMH